MSETGTTLAQALAAALAGGLARSDALGLAGHVLGRSKAWLIAHDDAVLSASDAQHLAALVQRRAAGEPLAYLTGWREFRSLMLAVGPDVLIPRPETEGLIDWAEELRPALPGRRVLDLGTGSGAIALALAAAGFAVTATDASAAALAVAQRNGERLGLPVVWRLGPWWQALPAQAQFDLIVSNPPYVAEGDAHLHALRHEPTTALVAGPDGLADLRAITAGALPHLAPGGWLLLEHGYDQGTAVRGLLQAVGLAQVSTRQDLAGLARCSGGQRVN